MRFFRKTNIDFMGKRRWWYIISATVIGIGLISEFTEIGTSGCGYVEFTAGEMNYDHVHVVFKCSNTSAMDVSVHLYQEEAGDIRAHVTQISGSATAADYLEIGALLNVPFTVAGTPSAIVFESDDVTNATADLYNGRVRDLPHRRTRQQGDEDHRLREGRLERLVHRR